MIFSDCPTCSRAKADCDDSAARGWDACCMTCDEIGRARNHRVLTVPVEEVDGRG